jgi:hypothetical protein
MRWPLLLVTFAACSYGDNLERAADAALPDTADVTPDAPPLCDADVSNSEQNCGECGFVCAGGEVCTNGECNCPANPIPTFIFPTGLEQFIPVGLFTLAIAPAISLNGLNGLVIGFDTALPLDTDIDLATVPLGSTPLVGALTGLDPTAMPISIDATYLATGGTIRFTKLCDTEIEGTITNATFNGVGGDILTNGGVIDPQGCEVQVGTITFHLMTTACSSSN